MIGFKSSNQDLGNTVLSQCEKYQISFAKKHRWSRHREFVQFISHHIRKSVCYLNAFIIKSINIDFQVSHEFMEAFYETVILIITKWIIFSSIDIWTASSFRVPDRILTYLYVHTQFGSAKKIIGAYLIKSASVSRLPSEHIYIFHLSHSCRVWNSDANKHRITLFNDILFPETLKSFSLSGMVSFVCILFPHIYKDTNRLSRYCYEINNSLPVLSIILEKITKRKFSNILDIPIGMKSEENKFINQEGKR